MPFNVPNKTLTWQDFPVKHESIRTTDAAYTVAHYTISPYSWHTVKGGVQISDVTVSMELNKTTSYVKDWALKLPADQSNALLQHENGHYLITYKLLREYYEGYLELRKKTFPSPAAVESAINDLKARTLDKISSYNLNYDNATHPEQLKGDYRGKEQQKWNKWFTPQPSPQPQPFKTPQPTQQHPSPGFQSFQPHPFATPSPTPTPYPNIGTAGKSSLFS